MLTFNKSNESYIGADDGWISLDPSTIETYIWADGNIHRDRVNLSPGVYNVSGTLSDGVTPYSEDIVIEVGEFEKLVVTEPNPSTISTSCPSEPDCVNCSDGQIVPPTFTGSDSVVITYTDSEGNVVSNTGLAPGNYTITLNGIDGQSSSYSVVVQDAQPYWVEVISRTVESEPYAYDGSADIRIHYASLPLNITSNDPTNVVIGAATATEVTLTDEFGEEYTALDLTISGISLYKTIYEGTYGNSGCNIIFSLPPRSDYTCDPYNVTVNVVNTFDLEATFTTFAADIQNYRLNGGQWKPWPGKLYNLDFGNYTIEFRNSMGCTIKREFTIYTLTEPKQTSAFTLSYSPATKYWVSFHSYKPATLISTSLNLYSTFNFLTFTQLTEPQFTEHVGIYKHNTGDRGVYYNNNEYLMNPNPSFIDVVFSGDKSYKLDMLKWYSLLLDEDKDLYLFDKSVTHIATYNPYFTSGLIKLDRKEKEYLKNNRQAEFEWSFNNVRSYSKPYHRFMREVILGKTFINSAIVQDRDSWYNHQSLGRTNVARFLYDNKENFKLMLKEINPGITESHR